MQSSEAGQTVSLIARPVDTALFSIPPSVSADGTLRFTPAPDANGSTTVTVRATDDGGTANGGADTSAPQTFTITVVPVNDRPSFDVGLDQSTAEDAARRPSPAGRDKISPGPGRRVRAGGHVRHLQQLTVRLHRRRAASCQPRRDSQLLTGVQCERNGLGHRDGEGRGRHGRGRQ